MQYHALSLMQEGHRVTLVREKVPLPHARAAYYWMFEVLTRKLTPLTVVFPLFDTFDGTTPRLDTLGRTSYPP
jgi:hypothetical protein